MQRVIRKMQHTIYKTRQVICRQVIVGILLSVLSLPLQAQPSYSLKQCLETGLANNFDILISRNDLKIATNNATLGNAGYLPSIGLNAGYVGTWNNLLKQHLFDGSFNSWNNINNIMMNADVNLNWMLFNGFKTQKNHKRLQKLKQISNLENRITVENFISDLTTEYYLHIRQKINLKNLTSSVALSRERLRIVEARYNIGSMSRLDLQQARVDFNTDSSRLLSQTEMLFASAIRLKELMALNDFSQFINVSDSTIQIDASMEKETLWNKLLQQNSLLLLASEHKTLSELDKKIVQSNNYPYLKLNAGYGYTFNHYETGAYDRQDALGLNYGITLGFNIFDGMNRIREQKNVQITVENTSLQYERLLLSICSNFANIWMSYQNNLELINLERENLATARENHEIAIERYKLGDLSGLELREAQNSLLEAEERLLLSEYNTKLCEISLLRISGQIEYYLEM